MTGITGREKSPPFHDKHGTNDHQNLRLFQHTFGNLEHTPKPLPTGYKGIPSIVGKGMAWGVRYRGVLQSSWTEAIMP